MKLASATWAWLGKGVGMGGGIGRGVRRKVFRRVYGLGVGWGAPTKKGGIVEVHNKGKGKAHVQQPVWRGGAGGCRLGGRGS